MALQLLKLPNHTIISRRFARWVGVPMHGTFAAVKFAKSPETLRWTYVARYTASQSHVIIFSARDTRWRCTMPWKVCVDGKVINKAGTPVSDKALVQIIAEVPKYVCRAGHKLEAAIEQLGHADMVNVMKEEATLVTLVNPQTEARRSQVGSGGIVSDPLVHQEVLDRIIKGVENFGFSSKGRIESPLKGAGGNTEFLVHFSDS